MAVDAAGEGCFQGTLILYNFVVAQDDLPILSQKGREKASALPGMTGLAVHECGVIGIPFERGYEPEMHCPKILKILVANATVPRSAAAGSSSSSSSTQTMNPIQQLSTSFASGKKPGSKSFAMGFDGMLPRAIFEALVEGKGSLSHSLATCVCADSESASASASGMLTNMLWKVMRSQQENIKSSRAKDDWLTDQVVALHRTLTNLSERLHHDWRRQQQQQQQQQKAPRGLKDGFGG